MTITEVKRWYSKGKANRYVWPGGYPLYYVTTDGGALCVDCMTRERAQIIRSTVENSRDGWSVSGQDVNWEDPQLYCDNCSERIESAYAEDSTEANNA